MSVNNQFRFDPFTGTFFPALLQEIHTVQFFDDWNAYGIQVAEGVFFENPSSVSIVENVTGGATYTEVPKSTLPGALQFQVDYTADGYFGTSRIKFNASQNGKQVKVNYKGLGLIANSPNYANIIANQTIPGTLGINAGTLPGHAVNKGQLDSEIDNVETIANFTKIVTGTGHAPTGTQVKMRWFEGTTDSTGLCTVSHGLSSNVLSFLAFVSDSFGNWNLLETSLGGNAILYDSLILFIKLPAPKYSNRAVRFLVWYK